MLGNIIENSPLMTKLKLCCSFGSDCIANGMLQVKRFNDTVFVKHRSRLRLCLIKSVLCAVSFDCLAYACGHLDDDVRQYGAMDRCFGGNFYGSTSWRQDAHCEIENELVTWTRRLIDLAYGWSGIDAQSDAFKSDTAEYVTTLNFRSVCWERQMTVVKSFHLQHSPSYVHVGTVKHANKYDIKLHKINHLQFQARPKWTFMIANSVRIMHTFDQTQTRLLPTRNHHGKQQNIAFYERRLSTSCIQCVNQIWT